MTLTCPHRLICKGACKHFRIGYQPLDEFFLNNKQNLKGTTLTTANAHLITQFASFLEAQKEDEYSVKKELLRDILAEQTKFQAAFCDKYQTAKLDEVVKQFPEKIVVEPEEMGLEIMSRHATPPSPRQRRVPEQRAFDQYIDAYYCAHIQGQVWQHYLATLLHQAFPDKVKAPSALSPDELILGLGLIPEAQRGQFYAQLADVAPEPQVLDYWKKAVAHERDPSALTDLYLSRGEQLIEAGQVETAIRLLQEGLAKAVEDLLLLERLAELEVERKDFKAAVEYLRRALEVAPEEWSEVVEGSEVFAPLEELPEFQILKKKYRSEG